MKISSSLLLLLSPLWPEVVVPVRVLFKNDQYLIGPCAKKKKKKKRNKYIKCININVWWMQNKITLTGCHPVKINQSEKKIIDEFSQKRFYCYLYDELKRILM